MEIKGRCQSPKNENYGLFSEGLECFHLHLHTYKSSSCILTKNNNDVYLLFNFIKHCHDCNIKLNFQQFSLGQFNISVESDDITKLTVEMLC